MRILDFKIPNFKFPKIKMKGIENLPEVQINYDEIENKKEEKKLRKKGFPETHYKTIKEIFLKSTNEFADRPFILEKFNPKESFTEITYKAFKEDVVALGTSLTKKFNLKDERIIIIGENTYHWYVSYMAAVCGAGIAVPIDKELPINEIENVIKRAKASVVIYSTKKKDNIKKVEDNLPFVKYFIQMNSDDKLSGRNIGLNTVIEEGKKLVNKGDNSFLDIKIDPEEFKVLIFTSGTTSQAKGVMICNRNLAENINAVNPYVYLTEKDRFFSVLPLHHCYECSIGFLLPMAVGASIVVCQGLKHIVDNMKETKPTAMLAVPLLIESLYKKINKSIEKGGKTGVVNSMIHVTNALKAVGIDIKRKVFSEIYENLGGNLKFIVSAAAPIDPKAGKWLQDIGIIFLQGYGLTETSPIAALTPEYEPKIGSAGKALVCSKLRINNPNEKGEGEILIKSSTLMLGYYENEEATSEVLKDGWLYTGDLGYIDKDGFLFITGRKKNVIVLKNGKNIYPEELENLINELSSSWTSSEDVGKDLADLKNGLNDCTACLDSLVIPALDRIIAIMTALGEGTKQIASSSIN